MIKIVNRIECNKCGKIIEPGAGKIIGGYVSEVPENLDERPCVVGDPENEVAYHDDCLRPILFPGLR